MSSDGSGGAPITLPPAVVDRLVSIHAKLLQLVESITELQVQIQNGGAQAMMGWHDILTKYSLLTSYTHSVFDLLVTPPSLAKAVQQHKATLSVEKPAYKTREQQRILAQQEQDAWRRTLSQSLVHAGNNIEAERDFIIGVLLRTKQIPEVEALEADLLKTVPSLDEPAELYRHLKVYEDLAEKALQACQRLKVGTDDREFNWKARVGPEDDEDEDDDEDNIARSPKNVKGAEAQPKYTTADLGRFMREGVLGR